MRRLCISKGATFISYECALISFLVVVAVNLPCESDSLIKVINKCNKCILYLALL